MPEEKIGPARKKNVVILVAAIASVVLAIGGYLFYSSWRDGISNQNQGRDSEGLSEGGTLLLGTRGVIRMVADASKEPVLMFTDAATGAQEPMVPGAFDDMERIDYPFFSAGKMYFAASPETNPVVKSVDLFSGKVETVPLDYDPEKPISSFFIKGRSIYYLSGEYCKDYMMKCRNMSLRSYNLRSGATRLLAEGIESGYINGFDETNDKVVMSQGFSDVGCGTWKYQTLTLSVGKIADIGSYSDCEPYLEESLSPFKAAVVGPNNRNFLVVKDGRVVPPEPEYSEINIIGIRIDESEYPKD